MAKTAKGPKMAKNGQKWHIMAHNGQETAAMTLKNCYKLPNIPKYCQK